MTLAFVQRKLDEVSCPVCSRTGGLQAFLDCRPKEICQVMCECTSCRTKFHVDAPIAVAKNSIAKITCDVASLTCSVQFDAA